MKPDASIAAARAAASRVEILDPKVREARLAGLAEHFIEKPNHWSATPFVVPDGLSEDELRRLRPKSGDILEEVICYLLEKVPVRATTVGDIMDQLGFSKDELMQIGHSNRVNDRPIINYEAAVACDVLCRDGGGPLAYLISVLGRSHARAIVASAHAALFSSSAPGQSQAVVAHGPVGPFGRPCAIWPGGVGQD